MSSETRPDVVIAVSDVVKRFKLFPKPYHRALDILSLGFKRHHQAFTALDGVSLEIRRGEAVGIIGRNGSGKSTLLQLICGTLSPSHGRVEVHGRIAALLELGAGFSPEFSGRENVYLNAALHGLSRAEVDARMADILAFADIGEFINQPVRTYSSGMYVRLAFAIIAHVAADVLVIDEALAVGDAAFSRKCMRFLRRFRRDGALLFVSHDTGAVTSLCNSAIWLDGGRVQETGSAKDVCEHYLGHVFDRTARSNEATGIEKTAAPPKQNSSAGRHVDTAPEDWIDARQRWINGSTLRNDLEVRDLDPDNTDDCGAGGAVIEEVRLTDRNGHPYRWIVGGEAVTLAITARLKTQLTRPVIGFYVKDRLGQTLFGDNTFLTTQTEDDHDPIAAKADDMLDATFHFPMPILPRGSYTITAAIADGDQADHTQHHWVYDAVTFTSHASHLAAGLVGIPMLDISLRRRTCPPTPLTATAVDGACADELPFKNHEYS